MGKRNEIELVIGRQSISDSYSVNKAIHKSGDGAYSMVNAINNRVTDVLGSWVLCPTGLHREFVIPRTNKKLFVQLTDQPKRGYTMVKVSQSEPALHLDGVVYFLHTTAAYILRRISDHDYRVWVRIQTEGK